MEKAVNLLAVLSSVLIHFTESGNNQRLDTLVSFGQLQELELKSSFSFETIEDIEPDQLQPGGILVATSNTIIKISPNLTTDVIAVANLSTVTDIEQFNNGSDIIVADFAEFCITKVDRKKNTITEFAGICGKPMEPGNTKDSGLNKPEKLLYVAEENAMFYILFSKKILKHNLTNDQITVMYYDKEVFSDAYAAVMDSKNRYLYVSHTGGISKIDTKASVWSLELVAGTNLNSSNFQRSQSKDGPLTTARFGEIPNAMTWLIKDQVLLVSEHGRALRIVNLEDGVVSTICKRQQSEQSGFITGNMAKCQVNAPVSVKAVDGVVYIGDFYGKPAELKGRVLTLHYSQPKCYPPEAKDLKNVLSFTPNKNEYINKDSIKFRCDNGYGVNSSYDTVTCVRALFDNGTVYGVWDKPLPVCEVAINKKRMHKADVTPSNKINIFGLELDPVMVIVSSVVGTVIHIVAVAAFIVYRRRHRKEEQLIPGGGNSSSEMKQPIQMGSLKFKDLLNKA